jgi:hypothetical protein
MDEVEKILLGSIFLVMFFGACMMWYYSEKLKMNKNMDDVGFGLSHVISKIINETYKISPHKTGQEKRREKRKNKKIKRKNKKL